MEGHSKADSVALDDVVVMTTDGDLDASLYAQGVSSASQPLLGELLVKEGLLTHLQVHEGLRVQKNLEVYKPLGQILVDQQAITSTQLKFVLRTYRKWLRLGEILIKSGAINEEQLVAALEQQKTTGLRLGETLLQLNYLNEEQMRHALCLQYNIPFVDLVQAWHDEHW